MEKKISIITDSAGDMLPVEAEKRGIIVIPLRVYFGEEEFEDGVSISRDEFYTRLTQTDVLPKTSMISPYRYEQAFRKEIDAGNDIVCLTVSSKMSGCWQSAVQAAQKFGDRVHVVDTMQFCGPEYLLAVRAADLRDRGYSAKEIAETIEAEKSTPRLIALLDTLKYLQLGGRISAAAGFVGGLLSVKPVITSKDGEVAVLGKARGSKNGNNYLMNFVKEHGGIDWEKPMLISWAGVSDELLQKYIADSAALYEGRRAEDLPVSRVGASIGTYAGPGAIAFSFYPQNPEAYTQKRTDDPDGSAARFLLYGGVNRTYSVSDVIGS